MLVDRTIGDTDYATDLDNTGTSSVGFDIGGWESPAPDPPAPESPAPLPPPPDPPAPESPSVLAAHESFWAEQRDNEDRDQRQPSATRSQEPGLESPEQALSREASPIEQRTTRRAPRTQTESREPPRQGDDTPIDAREHKKCVTCEDNSQEQ